MDILPTIPFEQGRDLVQDGDIIFVANKRGFILPQLIRFFTRSIFSHTAIAFWIDTPAGRRLLAVQAQGGNERFVMNVEAIDKCELYVVSPPKPWTEVAPLALVRLDKVPYGWLEAAYVGLREFFMTRFGWTLPEKDFTGEICSEFNARVLGLTDVNVSPQKLYEEVMKTQELRVIIKN